MEMPNSEFVLPVWSDWIVMGKVEPIIEVMFSHALICLLATLLKM